MAKRLGSVNQINFQLISWVRVCVALAGMLQINRVSGIECGTVNIIADLVRGGNETIKGAWPFAVVLHQRSNPKAMCGGTLISNKHILTAAHCVQPKFSRMIVPSHDFIAHLGVYNLTATNDNGVVQSNVTSIFVHPAWSRFNVDYDADLAIFVLSDNITFTKYIRPVCIPGDSIRTDSGIIDIKGSIVGWGETENGTYKDIPKEASVKALNDSFCYARDPAMAAYSSSRTFCGGFGDGDPGFGDSGTGFYVLSDYTWVQYGIVSSMRTNRTGHIIPHSMAVYTNVRSHKSWIVKTVEQNGGAVGEAMMTIKLNCIFGTNADDAAYGCWMKNFDIERDNVLVSLITGSHNGGRTHDNVEFLQFGNSSMICLPNGIGKIFRNLKELLVGIDLSTKFVRRSSFGHMKNLLRLHFFKNDIDTIDEDAFYELTNLEIFHIENSKVSELHEKSFEKNGRLKIIHLRLNERLKNLPPLLFNNNELLEEIVLDGNFLEGLQEQIFQNNPKLKKVVLKANVLQHLPVDLFKNNLLLEEIDLAENYIKTIDEQIFKSNPKLIGINLYSNLLQSLPKNLFENNSFLKDITLSVNYLQSIDGKLFENNVSLMQVFLGGMSLRLLPADIFTNNSQLENIHFGHNAITTIDGKCFAKNLNLQIVWFESNMIDELPSELFEKNLLLRSINFSNNSIITLDAEIFKNNDRLKSVYLSFNLLESLPANIFTNKSFLSTVDLSHNRLSALDEDIFTNNSRLKKVVLSHNRLNSLPKKMFTNNSLLESVDFSNNFLLSIEFDFTELRYIKLIIFDKNICIDDFFVIRYRHSESFEELAKFQSLVRRNCSSATNTSRRLSRYFRLE